ncbi:uncharacterized protein APUU_30799A [Aspergillus puulaauensis]|uniref:Nucleoside phosphorylase domain-containing protein n=1 Tax=Aspergillus puulaauensis TaxID=1220207 RepID=A0A7R7XL47_9EURO|nr:uncharacterized protein APUU_30799A [Aspergillus puulaauensis]BCS22574.1 hypothetical protein APUU_30799A [Aspergillus puulaauensis]
MTRLVLPPASRYSSKLQTARYTVGWICVLPTEFSAARRMLDEEYPADDLIRGEGDRNSYILGRIGKHNVVLNCPPAGTSGELRAARTATDMKSSFPWIRFVLLVGIGGGVPARKHDIRLGDVVAGTSVVPLDKGAATDHGFRPDVKCLWPPDVLSAAVTFLESHLQARNLARIVEEAATDPVRGRCSRPKIDRLYCSSYLHHEDCDCLRSDPEYFTRIHHRNPRQGTLVSAHHGRIGSGNAVIKDAHTRDEYAKRHNVLCVEMEAVGVMEVTGCLPIRGISDYADGHKNDDWQPYAALAAAVYAKELLQAMSTADVERCVLHVAGNILESFINGAVCSASSHSAGSSLQSAQSVMEGLMDRHEIVVTLLDGPIQNLGDQTRIKLEDVQKVKELQSSQTRIQEALQHLGARVDQQAENSNYVTRAEWEKLRAQVQQNTSNIEALSTTTQDTLDTTVRLMDDLGHHINKEKFIFVARILNSAKEYTDHATRFGKAYKGKERRTKDSESTTTSPPPSEKAGPSSSGRAGTAAFSNSQPQSGPEPQSPTPSFYENFRSKFTGKKETGSRSSTPTEESRPKIPPRPLHGFVREPVTSPISPYLHDSPATPGGLRPGGHGLPPRPNIRQPPRPSPQRQPSPRTQPQSSNTSRHASPSGRPNQAMQDREMHTPRSQQSTGGSAMSGTTLSSQHLSEQMNEKPEEAEYERKPVKDIRSMFEQGGHTPSSKK